MDRNRVRELRDPATRLSPSPHVASSARYRRQGKHEEQLLWLERAVELHPRSDEARQALAKAQASKRRSRRSPPPPFPAAPPMEAAPCPTTPA
ncbi:tetratricopeptide repeat protein [Archangium minus]|uniref:tetratricopeptide repeat protein n=1 Tax=Archangium minus TaxID=83450 RepID=UPI0037C1B349